ncbi:MAG TPA: hypothetical protein VF384_00490 [Planctomycetota bacterium]
MGILDKLKGAMNFVTGGGARVTLEVPPNRVQRGQPVQVRVTVSSTGGVVKTAGVFVDVIASERVRVPAQQIPIAHRPQVQPGQSARPLSDLDLSRQNFDQKFPIAPAFELQANETKVFEGTIQLPTHVPGTYNGVWASHEWRIRGRIEVSGNDPDSGFSVVCVE